MTPNLRYVKSFLNTLVRQAPRIFCRLGGDDGDAWCHIQVRAVPVQVHMDGFHLLDHVKEEEGRKWNRRGDPIPREVLLVLFWAQ